MDITKAINLIKQFEGIKLQAYKCPAGVWTIGYGHTKGVKQGQVIDLAKAEEFLRSDLNAFIKKVDKYDKIYHFTENEYNALLSFCFNIGSIDQLTANGTRSKQVIGNKILLYTKAGGVRLGGLVRRRQAEHDLYVTK